MVHRSTWTAASAFTAGPGQHRLMRARVESNWTTRVLLFVVFVAAGVIAWQRVESWLEAERARTVARERPPTHVVEIELDESE